MNEPLSRRLQSGVDLSRRRFLVVGSTLSGSLLIGLPVAGFASREDPEGHSRIGYFINILDNGDVIIGNNQPEIGQGLRTTLPMLVAEELDVDWNRVRIEPMPLGIVKTADGYTWKYGGQGVGGSTGLTSNWTFMREVGATGRMLLMQAAAERWGVPVGQCRTRPGEVVCDGTGQSAPYGDLVKAASALPLPGSPPPLKPPADYRIVGKAQQNKEVEDIVTGRIQFGSDTQAPGMRYAVILRAPVFNATVARVDDTGARAVDGVLDVFPIEGPAPGAPYVILAHGVAVVATSTWAAIEGRKALKVEWNESPNRNDSSERFWRENGEMLAGQGQIVHDQGDFPTALATAEKVVRRRYEVPFVSHAPMEPQNCYAHVRDNEVHVIAPTQMPAGASRSAAAVTGVDRLNIRVDIARSGGGFGRRLTNDYVAEACLVSMKTGWPIKLQWTREDDMRHDFYRPGGTHELVAGLDADGRPWPGPTDWPAAASITAGRRWKTKTCGSRNCIPTTSRAPGWSISGSNTSTTQSGCRGVPGGGRHTWPMRSSCRASWTRSPMKPGRTRSPCASHYWRASRTTLTTVTEGPR